LWVTNTFLYDGNDPNNCCTLGYHSATASLKGNGQQQVQTMAFASWADAEIFGDGNTMDIHGLSHELSEWMNDPFVHNAVPPWAVPSAPQYGCSGSLETGDPLVGYAWPVTIGGYTYHPQNEAILPWFARQSPSTAIDGAYTYPDTTLFTSIAPGCN
jgi:hypothetical protein